MKLILNQQSPFSIRGDSKGISFLFPMQTLFERYVTKILEKNAKDNYSVEKQVRSVYLSEAPKAFLLKPDIAISQDGQVVSILDTKWKLIDQNALYDNGNEDKKANISQADMYQMFAYGHKYLKGGKGKLVLIYPQWSNFNEMKQFDLGNGLVLYAFPFVLNEADKSALNIFELIQRGVDAETNADGVNTGVNDS
ncbi:MAG: hypothetical protein D0531_12135 [Methylococcales bacterium]|nr:MAG: hypothetical protein D0531_12135 [Methylococcales bacterium]